MKTKLIYIANFKSKQIFIFKMSHFHKNIELLQIINICGNGRFIKINPKKKYLYLGTQFPPKIITYRINKFGLLTQENSIKLQNNPTHFTINLQGNMLYCASYTGNSVTIHPIKDGNVCKKKQILNNLLTCHSVNIDFINKNLWIPCLTINKIYLYPINETGYLEESTINFIEMQNNPGPRHMVFHNKKNYAYIINELNGTVSIISTNKLLIIQTISIHPTISKNVSSWSAEIYLTINNKWLYCTDRATSTISCFSVSEKGDELVLIYYKKTENQPYNFDIDVTGKFLAIIGKNSHCMSIYKIDSKTGKLTTYFRKKVGKEPISICFYN
ncbi:6-phosphogluconolactonase [Candidatus Westeberhardia cardiocondylae]|uniref:6-phosphogluconolactonase n=1 Tax=Candidatus Westeberhardia cardiocondylae TaxID=1594731 RepID=A0A0H5BWT4_9ENTR|nr:beta-propeller fold lactonase family protein [Candidatus Westeberhardia cardiocondylae]CEN32200.1 6-phosphogluconolactonase [Candidatus Westeberhardia cardiocondylae]